MRKPTVRRGQEDSREGIDFIGDIHGHHELLVSLLERLGYESSNSNGYCHPEERQVVFLGDYIDRGPEIPETLQLVRRMVESGSALALMGNHEFNAVAFATPSSGGDYLRPHNLKNCRQHRETLEQFRGNRESWQDYLDWFKSLPMWLDLGGARSVHACWDPPSMEILEGRDLQDPDFLRLCSTEGEPEYSAVETILKGPELPVPDGYSLTDKQGVERSSVRTRWWDLSPSARPLTFRDIAMPPGSCLFDLEVLETLLDSQPGYDDAIPVFIGHYWLPAAINPTPLSHNIACLDYSVGQGGPLVAYRWDGESQLSGDNMVWVHPCPTDLEQPSRESTATAATFSER